MNKLELKHIAPYLPYGLEVLRPDNITTLKVLEISFDGIISVGENAPKYCNIKGVKPILRPINSITKEEALEFGILLTNENEMNDKEIGIGSLTLGDMVIPTIYYQDTQDDDFSIMIQFGGVGIGGRDLIPFEAYNWLFENHFDVFGLIEKGLAIDKNKL